jgi:hypothetical protein
MPLTKLSLAWNNLIIPGQGGFGPGGQCIPAKKEKTANLLLQCTEMIQLLSTLAQKEY